MPQLKIGKRETKGGTRIFFIGGSNLQRGGADLLTLPDFSLFF